MKVISPPARSPRRALVALTGAALIAAPLVAATTAQAAEPADSGWSYRIDNIPTGISQGYQAAFDATNRKVYLADASARRDTRTKVDVYDNSGAVIGWKWEYSSSGGVGQLVEIDAAKRQVTRTFDYGNLTRLDGTKQNAQQNWDAPNVTSSTTSLQDLRTHFSPNGVAIDPSTEYDGVKDPTIITTHVRQQGYDVETGTSAGYGGGIVVYRASQGAPTDADRIWKFDDGEQISDGSRRIAVNTKTHKAYIGNFGTGRSADPSTRRGYITVIDLPTKTVEARIAIPAPVDTQGGTVQDGGPIGVTVDEANNHVYVGQISADTTKNTKLFRIDASGLDTTNAKDKTLNASKVTELDAAVPSNARPVYNAEQKRLYVASYNTGKISVVDADTASADYGKLITTFDSPEVNSVAVDATRGLLYSANLGEKTVNVYSTKTFEQLLEIPTGDGTRPNDVHVDPATGEVWVGHFSAQGLYPANANVIRVFEPNVSAHGNDASEIEVAASSSVFGKAGKATVLVTDADGRSATGTVTLNGAGSTLSAKLKRGEATFTLPATLARKSHALSVRYAGNSDLAPSTATATHTVVKASTSSAAKLTKRPTSKKTGTLRVTVRQSSGSVKATGSVTVTLKKGKSTKRVKATVKSGVATVKLPKLKKGTWRATAKYAGNGNYGGSSAKATVKVRK